MTQFSNQTKVVFKTLFLLDTKISTCLFFSSNKKLDFHSTHLGAFSQLSAMKVSFQEKHNVWFKLYGSQ